MNEAEVSEVGLVKQDNSVDKSQVQQISTKVFKPTASMRKWFQAAVEAGFGGSITEIATKSGVDRTNWYIWLAKEGFVEWWDAQWQRHLQLNRWKLDAIGMKQAERSFDYWQAMQKRTGNMVDEKAEQQVPTLVQNILANDLSEFVR